MCQKHTKILFKYLIGHGITFLFPFLFSIYCVYIGDVDTSTWQLRFQYSLIFNSNNLWNWYFAWVCECMSAMAYASCIVASTTYFICCCLYIEAICEHFKWTINMIREKIDENQNVKIVYELRNPLKIKKEMNQAVELQTKALE